MSTDLSDYSIIKEGEAEILMHAKNEVFYNKTQVLFFIIVFLALLFFFYLQLISNGLVEWILEILNFELESEFVYKLKSCVTFYYNLVILIGYVCYVFILFFEYSTWCRFVFYSRLESSFCFRWPLVENGVMKQRTHRVKMLFFRDGHNMLRHPINGVVYHTPLAISAGLFKKTCFDLKI